jgi:hypothetical protein
VGGCKLSSSLSENGPIVGSCKHGNEPAGCIKCKEFFDLQTDY